MQWHSSQKEKVDLGYKTRHRQNHNRLYFLQCSVYNKNQQHHITWSINQTYH